MFDKMGDRPADGPTFPTTLSPTFRLYFLGMPGLNGFPIRIIIVMNGFYLPAANMIRNLLIFHLAYVGSRFSKHICRYIWKIILIFNGYTLKS